MQVDSLALTMRPRAPHEAADLGIRLCQASAREVYACYLLVAIPTALLAFSLYDIAPFWTGLLMWCAKPWLDRTVLFVLSRAAFGQRTRISDLWREQRTVWWRQFFSTWTLRRLSPWRSFTQPVFQLEGLPFGHRRKRVLQLRRRYTTSAMMMTSGFSFAETGISLALVSLLYWFAPPGQTFEWSAFVSGIGADYVTMTFALSYLLTVLFLEPFYVAAGFGMYLNRRAELEAWDIEQEFRRAFAA